MTAQIVFVGFLLS